MRLQANGIVTLGAEIVLSTPFGNWIDIAGKDYYLDYNHI